MGVSLLALGKLTNTRTEKSLDGGSFANPMLANTLSFALSLLTIAAKSAVETLVSFENGLAILIAVFSAMDTLCLISNLMFAPALIRCSTFWNSALVLAASIAGLLPIALLSY